LNEHNDSPGRAAVVLKAEKGKPRRFEICRSKKIHHCLNSPTNLLAKIQRQSCFSMAGRVFRTSPFRVSGYSSQRGQRDAHHVSANDGREGECREHSTIVEGTLAVIAMVYGSPAEPRTMREEKTSWFTSI